MSIKERESCGGLEQLLSGSELADVAVRAVFAEGDTVAREGRSCGHLFVVSQGLVGLYRRTDEGCRMFALLRPGDVLGEEALSGSHWRTTARALTEVEVLALPATLLPRVTQLHPGVNRWVVEALARRLDMTQRLLTISGPARERVLQLLRLISDADDRPGSYVEIPPLTQHQIGEMLGMARETVARSMAELERTGAIHRSGRVTWLRRHGTMVGLAFLLCARAFTGAPVYAEDEAPPPRGRRGRVARAPAMAPWKLMPACVKP